MTTRTCSLCHVGPCSRPDPFAERCWYAVEAEKVRLRQTRGPDPRRLPGQPKTTLFPDEIKLPGQVK